MNTDLRKKAKNDFEKKIFKLMNNSVFGKTMKNSRKYRDIKLVITGKRRNYLVPKPSYHSTKFLKEHVLAIDMRKTQIPMNKPLYLGLRLLELCVNVMYHLWYDCLKPKYGEKAKICYMDTDSFIIYV